MCCGQTAVPTLSAKRFADLVADPSFLSVTGIGVELGPNSAMAKCLWFRDHEPVLYSKASRIMTISDYLTYRFSGELRGDEGTASLLGIFDLKNGTPLGGRTQDAQASAFDVL